MPYPAEYSSKVFIPLPADEAVKTVIGDSYNPETALNVIKMFAGTDDLFAATIGLVKAVFQTGGIDPKAREIIILRSATILNVPYEWQANAKMPTNAGLSHDEIAAASAEGPVTGIDPEYVLLCKATDELSLTGTLTDETLTSMLRRYDEIIEVGDRYVQWCSKHLPVSPTVSGADRYQLRTRCCSTTAHNIEQEASDGLHALQ
jgi:alkylhydroperoxidase/carboxymuconolactone decarboxylase family protein YurZ